MIYFILALFGLALGSFVNALVFRLRWQSKNSSKKKAKSKKYSIAHGKSMCPHCKQQLATKDLVPVFSWISLRGKCRYCGRKISRQYPVVELTTAALFVISYIFWPREVVGWEWLQFGVWLAAITGFVALIVYDLRYMLLPNRIIFPLTGFAVFGVIAQSVVDNSTDPLKSAAYGLLVGGGLFYILFQISNGSWIGGGDVKLGLLLGILVGGPGLALVMLFLASFAGTLVTLPFLASGRLSPKTRIPFGPFLIAGAVISQFFGKELIDIYSSTLL